MAKAEFISLRQTLSLEFPLQIPGVINACAALLAQQAGFKALYLSGAGIANSLGLPDLGMTTLTEVSQEIEKITSTVSLPLLVDGDTGFGSTLTIERMVKCFIQAGGSGVHIEDQVYPKRCGHRPGKELASVEEMKDRLQAALLARDNPEFLIVARTDALTTEGLEATLHRALEYQAVGADMIFLEAATTLEDYRAFSRALSVPILANITEFGKTPLFKLSELKEAGVGAVLYPLSAFRAMNQAALEVYQCIREKGTQAPMVDRMQTREALYQLLDYYQYEEKLT